MEKNLEIAEIFSNRSPGVDPKSLLSSTKFKSNRQYPYYKDINSQRKTTQALENLSSFKVNRLRSGLPTGRAVGPLKRAPLRNRCMGLIKGLNYLNGANEVDPDTRGYN